MPPRHRNSSKEERKPEDKATDPVAETRKNSFTQVASPLFPCDSHEQAPSSSGQTSATFTPSLVTQTEKAQHYAVKEHQQGQENCAQDLAAMAKPRASQKILQGPSPSRVAAPLPRRRSRLAHTPCPIRHGARLRERRRSVRRSGETGAEAAVRSADSQAAAVH